MTRRFAILALAAALGGFAALPAGATSYPRVVGSGENASVEYGPGPRGNIVGGGRVAVTGGGENIDLRHLDAQFAQAPQRNLIPRVIGSGENATVVYLPSDISTIQVALIGSDGSLPAQSGPGGGALASVFSRLFGRG